MYRRKDIAKLFDGQKSLLKLSYNVIKNPKNLRRHLNRYRYDKGVLRKSEIDFTPPIFIATIIDNCNLRCPTCLYLLEDPDKFFSNYISSDKFCQVLEKYNKEMRAETIFLTGGEPLLHPDFDQLVDICKEYSLSPKISTNGTLVKSKISSLLKLDYVNVSIDAYDYESYKKYRGGTPEQFDSLMGGLRALKQNGVYFSMSYLLSTENISEVDKMIALAEEIKPNFVYFHNINPHGCEQYKPLTIQDENTKIFLKKLLKRSDYPFNIDVSVIFDPKSPSFLQAKCIQPWYYFCFNSVGDVSYCCHLSHDANIGNVFNDYNLNSQEMVTFRKDIMRSKVAKSCLYCQRRFMGKEFGSFDSKNGKWVINFEKANIFI